MITLSRRALLGAAGAAALAATALPAVPGAATVQKRLRVTTRTLDVGGRAARVLAIADEAGRMPVIAGRAGETRKVRVENALDEPTVLHWHGQTPPWRQDGVADLTDLTQPAIPPGGMWEYDFPLRAGTHWMHSHRGLQEQALLAVPMIVRTAEEEAADEQEIVILLHDLSFRPAAEFSRNWVAAEMVMARTAATRRRPRRPVMPDMAPARPSTPTTSSSTPTSPMIAPSPTPRWWRSNAVVASVCASSTRRRQRTSPSISAPSRAA